MKAKETSIISIPSDLSAEEEALALALTLKVKAQSDYDDCSLRLEQATIFVKKVEALYEPHISAANSLLKGLKADLKKHTANAESFRAYMRPLLGAFIKEEERKAAEKAEKLKAKIIEKAEAKGMDAETLSEKLSVVSVKAPEKGKLSFRTKYSYRVVNEKAVPEEFWIHELDSSKINRVFSDSKGEATIPGLEVVIEKTPIERY